MLYQRISAVFLWLALAISPVINPAIASENAAQSILHILDYVSVDYPETIENGKITNLAEYKEQQEFAQRLFPLLGELPENENKPALQALATQLVQAIDKRNDGETIRRLCIEFSTQLIGGYKIVTAPRKPASIQHGAQLFENNCSSCHGLKGFGDGPAAKNMEPAPNNFHDRQRQGQRSPYSLFSTITLGVDGTAMKSFAHLGEQQRWDLAFYLSTLYHTENELSRGEQLWEQGQHHQLINNSIELSRTTPDELKQQYGDNGLAILAYLRAHPEALETGELSPLQVSRQKVIESVEAYEKGDFKLAYELAVNAYLEGFELAEAAISNVAPEMKSQVEREMGNFRQLVKNREDLQSVEQHAQNIIALLQQAEDKLVNTELSSGVAFVSSLVILLREGLEAILVLAAIAAFLAKTERKDAMHYMHAGWVGALLLGFVTWLLAEYAFDFSGASRELTEGITGLFAAAMLVYIGFWLHNHTHAEKWKAFIQSKLHGVTSGTVWSLTIISFIAVYREVVETVLFYKTLWLQTEVAGHSAILAGFATASVSLVLIAWAIFRFSVRLPISLFFRINSALLYVMAIVFAGKGIAALQEAGNISIHHISFPQFDLLGVYPTLESIGLQAALIFLAIGWLGLERLKERPIA
ncbi:MAG: cytochrome c/FTR1 family iron permease [Gammaproteobacteria bacterium]